jgi:hypothetical protein
MIQYIEKETKTDLIQYIYSKTHSYFSIAFSYMKKETMLYFLNMNKTKPYIQYILHVIGPTSPCGASLREELILFDDFLKIYSSMNENGEILNKYELEEIYDITEACAEYFIILKPNLWAFQYIKKFICDLPIYFNTTSYSKKSYVLPLELKTKPIRDYLEEVNQIEKILIESIPVVKDIVKYCVLKYL